MDAIIFGDISASCQAFFSLAPQFCAADNARVPFTEPDRSWHELQADAKLAEIALHEELAEIYDESVGHERQQFARKYRELIGVHPDQRADFRIVLENVREGGQRPVQDIIADFQDQSQNSSVVGD